MCVPTNYKITGFKFQSDSINTNTDKDIGTYASML